MKFYYVYKQLAHPETNSYIDPVNLKERLAHVQAASKSFQTGFTWICDNMENDLKHSMGNAPNSEFVIDADGKVVIKRNWSNPQQLRQDLARLVGKSETTTAIADLGYQVNPRPEQAARGVVERIKLPGRMTALKTNIESNSEGEQFFVKLRAEADDDLIRSGTGKLYLAFHIDPIYRVHWNNDSAPVAYELELPDGISSGQLKGTGPRVEVSADVDPREFLIDVEAESRSTGPIQVTVRFMICDDDETFCVPVTQVFSVMLEKDPELGWRMAGRQNRGGQNRGRQGDRWQQMLRRDTNGDGKISKDEFPERMRDRFDQMDRDGNGFIEKSEIESMSQGQRRRGRDR